MPALVLLFSLSIFPFPSPSTTTYILTAQIIYLYLSLILLPCIDVLSHFSLKIILNSITFCVSFFFSRCSYVNCNIIYVKFAAFVNFCCLLSWILNIFTNCSLFLCSDFHVIMNAVCLPCSSYCISLLSNIKFCVFVPIFRYCVQFFIRIKSEFHKVIFTEFPKYFFYLFLGL